MSENLIIRREGSAGRISLNRPRALNALTQEMCEGMAAALLEWRKDDAIQTVMIDHALNEDSSGRGFCAGGDVVSARRSSLEDEGEAGRAFFHAEYQLNHLLFTYPKPVITFMDGVTMGGGVGLALPAKYRIATENTLFAMPEGSIGLFPDVGAGWYLPRLPGQIGKFLALTGARLDGAECLWAGLATHYLPPENLAQAKADMAANPSAIAEILTAANISTPEPRLASNAENIDRLFAAGTLEGILADLTADPSKWAGKELKAVSSKCPTSSKIALRLFAHNAEITDFAEEMALEYRIVARMIARHDFIEGVRAVLVDKDNSPRWQPETAQQASPSLLDGIFQPFENTKEFTTLSV